MKREAILHIGPMKTGSTSIQGWLRRSRDALAICGLYVPTRPGIANLSRVGRVAYAAAHETPIDDAQVATFWQLLTREFDELPESARSVIISGEIMGQRLREPFEVEALKTLLSPWFDRFRVILYLRRQDEISVSLFSTRVRNRATADEQLLSSPVDYAALLETWGTVFGREALTPRLFDRADLVGGDVIADFAAALGVPSGSIDLTAPVKNQSLTSAAQNFFRQLYTLPGSQGSKYDFDPDNYTRVKRIVTRTFSGGGRLPTRDEAIAFLATVEASNEAVRAEWFPSRERLFSDDFSKYPVERPAEPPADELLDVAFCVISTLLSNSASAGRRKMKSADDLDEVVRDLRSKATDSSAISVKDRSERRGGKERLGARRGKERTGSRGDNERPKRRKSNEAGRAGERPGLPASATSEVDGAAAMEAAVDDKVVTKAARALWRLGKAAGDGGAASAARPGAWAEQKTPYLSDARKLLQTLRHDGVEVRDTNAA